MCMRMKRERKTETMNELTNERTSQQKCWWNKQTRPQFKEISNSLAKVIVFHTTGEPRKKQNRKHE